MWIRINDAMINLDNVAEISCLVSGTDEHYGLLSFFSPEGKELDTAYYKTKKGYDKAVEKLQRYTTFDLTERADESIQDTV